MDWPFAKADLYVRKAAQGMYRAVFPSAADDQTDPSAMVDHGDTLTEYRVRPTKMTFDASLSIARIFQLVPEQVWATVVTHAPDGHSMYGSTFLRGFMTTDGRVIYQSTNRAGYSALSNDGALLFSTHVRTETLWNPGAIDELNAWRIPPPFQPFCREYAKRFGLTVESGDRPDQYRVNLDILAYRQINFDATDVGGVLVSPTAGKFMPIASGMTAGHPMVLLISLRANNGSLLNLPKA